MRHPDGQLFVEIHFEYDVERTRLRQTIAFSGYRRLIQSPTPTPKITAIEQYLLLNAYSISFISLLSNNIDYIVIMNVIDAITKECA